MRKLFLLCCLLVALQAKMVDAVAVVVEDEIITLYDITKEMRTAHVTKKEAMEILIRKKLEEMEIKKRGISVSEDEIYDEIRRLAEANKMSISQFYDAVRESNGLSSSELKEKIKERLLSQKLYQSIAMSKLSEPSQSEIEEYFRLHKKEFALPSFVDVIVYSSPKKELLEQKMTNPMFFSAEITQQEQRLDMQKLNPQLAQILLRTPEGSFTQILPNPQGSYMTFYVQKKGAPSEVKLEDIRPRIINAIMAQKRAQILDDYFEKLKDSADIKILRD